MKYEDVPIEYEDFHGQRIKMNLVTWLEGDDVCFPYK